MGGCVSSTDKRRQNGVIVNKLLNKSKMNLINLKIIETYDNVLIKESNISIDVKKKIENLFEELKLNTKSEYDLKLPNGQIISNINKNQIIFDIISSYIKSNTPIELSLIYKGLLIPQNIIQAYIEHNPIIGSPILDNVEYFALIIFSSQNKGINFFKYSQMCSNVTITNKFNHFSAYCNANGLLYLSGGENESSEEQDKSNVEYNDFYSIDLNHLLQTKTMDLIDDELIVKQLPNLLEPRTWHSMIFVPSKYIFIVGGSTKSVELYDIEKNIITKDSELNESRNECTLCLINDTYLYAICGFILHKTFNHTVEKCNLRIGLRKWEYVNFNVSNNMKFCPSFFCVSYFNKNEILLIGGNDTMEENNKSYIIELAKDENSYDKISEFNLEKDKFGVFRDKLFTPIDETYAVNIPLMYGEHIQILLMDMKTGKIEQKNYDDIFNDDK